MFLLSVTTHFIAQRMRLINPSQGAGVPGAKREDGAGLGRTEGRQHVEVGPLK
jgi:hypothetical protein